MTDVERRAAANWRRARGVDWTQANPIERATFLSGAALEIACGFR